MFKTIHECRLDLVAHTMASTYDFKMPQSDLASSGDMDFMPCSAARVSFGNEDKTGESPAADKKLMKYLADHQHMTPFEHQSATFLLEVPLFIRSQIMRHRTFAYNEISRRYTDENLEFWIPDKWRRQAASNRQASSSEEVSKDTPLFQDAGRITGNVFGLSTVETQFKTVCVATRNNYEELLKAGVCREQARAVLPQSLLTKFYMTGNLRNWAHFIRLRKDGHAQAEIRVVAERIRDELKKLWPNSMEALGV